MGTGANALYSNTTGIYNMANGSNALLNNTTGNYNVADGLNALYSNTTGNANIAIGISSGGDLTTGNNNIDIGNRGVAGESGKIRIGTTGLHSSAYLAGVAGTAIAGGVGVVIDTNGHLGMVASSGRFKEDVKPMAQVSEALLKLEPVTFRYKKELDPEGIAQFGLIAEQVEKVDPNLGGRDENGRAYTVRYDAVNAMLLNEFLKEHREIAKLKSELADQRKQIEMLIATLRAQSQEPGRVSAQLKTNEGNALPAANQQD
jgi:trimeric autotransporter adhesin